MAKRRTAGEGTINPSPNGSWRAQVSLRGKRLSFTSKSQQACRDWIRKIRDQIDQGYTYDDERTTVGKFMEGWLATKKREIRAASGEQYTWVCKSFIEPQLGPVLLKKLGRGRIQEFYDNLSIIEKGPQTIRLVHIVLRMCMQHAKNMGLIASNPTDFCKLPKVIKNEMKFWTEDQVSQFLLSIRGHKNENLYYLALSTGMRRGELLGLKWIDVDWVNKRLIIRRQCCNPAGGGFVFQAPKTNKGFRSVQLGMNIIGRLQDQLNKIDLMRRISRDKWQDFDLVFPSLIGKPQYGNNVSIEFHELVNKSGLSHIRFHDCRHTAASLLLNHGIPAVVVAGLLGHSVSTLITNYAHFIPESQDEAAQLMSDITSAIPVEIPRRGQS